MTDLLRRAIIETCLDLGRLDLNQGKSGNVSARHGAGCLITPSGIAYARMTPDQIVALDPDGGYDGRWAPSSEWRMHADLYRAVPEAGAVIHTHSAHATALSCLRRPIPPFHYMVAIAGGPDIRCSDYALFGTQALSATMLDAIRGRRACLLANHGLICWGPDLPAALALAVEVEALARQYLLACAVQEPMRLTEAEMADALEAFKGYGAQGRA